MTDQPTQDAIVSQRDREVAAKLLGGAAPDGLLEGKRDHLSLIQALATYRAEIEAATIERCANHAKCAFDDRPNSRSGHHSEMDWTDGYRDGTRSAEAAIRNLKGQTS